MARAVCSSAPRSRAAPLFRTCRLGWGLVRHVLAVSRGSSPCYWFPQLGPSKSGKESIIFWLLNTSNAAK